MTDIFKKVPIHQ